MVGNDAVNHIDRLGLVEGVPSHAVAKINVLIEWWDDDGGFSGGNDRGSNDDWLASASASLKAWCYCGSVKTGDYKDDKGTNSFWWGEVKYYMLFHVEDLDRNNKKVIFTSEVTTGAAWWVDLIFAGAGAALGTPGGPAMSALGAAVGMSAAKLWDAAVAGEGRWRTSAAITCPEWSPGSEKYQKPIVKFGGVEPFGIANRRTNVGRNGSTAGFEHYVPWDKTFRWVE
jgi:hypothetical protein